MAQLEFDLDFLACTWKLIYGYTLSLGWPHSPGRGPEDGAVSLQVAECGLAGLALGAGNGVFLDNFPGQ